MGDSRLSIGGGKFALEGSDQISTGGSGSVSASACPALADPEAKGSDASVMGVPSLDSWVRRLAIATNERVLSERAHPRASRASLPSEQSNGSS